jgi:hypothetical protein
MKKHKIITIGIYATLLILGCNNNSKDLLENSPMAPDSTSNAIVPSSAAVENNKDSSKKFIRTADVKFKVKSVIQSTYDIENITNRHGGYVTFTNLSSNINNVTLSAISADSSLETTYYTVTNTITLRIPNTKLDTTLKEIANNIDFLDYRIIKAEDVGLQILSNNLTQKRTIKNEERLTNAIDNRGKKLNETTIAEETLLNKQEQVDYAKISNLSLADQVNFSTINLSIYQKPTIKREVNSNEKNIDEYEPGLGIKLLEALKYGWNIIETLIIFLTKLWGQVLFSFLVYLLYKKFRKK